MSRALDLILTGRAVSAHEALAFGLANRVVANGDGARGGGAAGRRTRGVSAGCVAGRPPLGAGKQHARRSGQKRCGAKAPAGIGRFSTKALPARAFYEVARDVMAKRPRRQPLENSKLATATFSKKQLRSDHQH
jgi:enoyl-CoA hydratase/carnithine racemase